MRGRLTLLDAALHILFLILPYLLQFSLLMCTCALSVYLWEISTVLTGIVLFLTLCAIPFYLTFGMLALGFSHLKDLTKQLCFDVTHYSALGRSYCMYIRRIPLIYLFRASTYGLQTWVADTSSRKEIYISIGTAIGGVFPYHPVLYPSCQSPRRRRSDEPGTTRILGLG